MKKTKKSKKIIKIAKKKDGNYKNIERLDNAKV